VAGAGSTHCGSRGGDELLIGGGRAATGDAPVYGALVVLQRAVIEAKGLLLRVVDISHFKRLSAGRELREVGLPVVELR
jgi:hypothetical protein